MPLLIRGQLIAAFIGFVLTVASFLAGTIMKHWLRSPVSPRTARLWHRRTAWSSLGIYLGISYTCLRYHFPVNDPLKALDYGWFLIHPVNGFVGVFIYLGKILVVRKWRKGWHSPGALFGGAILFFWLLQIGTIASWYLP